MLSICLAIPPFTATGRDLQPDSDLGERLVTREVDALLEQEIEEALRPGARRARQLLAAGLIEGAALRLLGETVVVGASGFCAPPPFTEGTGRFGRCVSRQVEMSAVIRKIVTVVEETHIEMGKGRAADTAGGGDRGDRNPFAGRYVEDFSPLIAIGEELGDLLSKRAVAALGIDGAKAHSYGKAAAVGENGELDMPPRSFIPRWAPGARCCRRERR